MLHSLPRKLLSLFCRPVRINPQEFQKCFFNWMKSIQKITSGGVVAIDGKTLCGSYDKSNEQSAIVMVSAWATANKVVLGQVKVGESFY